MKNGVWNIFGESLKLYFLNFDKFMRYLAFPVLGQLFGMLLIVFLSNFYVTGLPSLVAKNNIFNNFSTIFIIFLMVTLPGLFIFTKAVWDYLIAYGAINSMAENAMRSGRVYDFAAHNELITRRSAGFFAVWLLFGIFSLVGLFPLFWIIAGILFVYFVLIFQVFTFEPDKSPVGCFKKSFTIIKGNFGRTCLLMFLVGGLTYWALPQLVQYLFDLGHITTLLAIPFDGCARQLPLDDINKMCASIPHFVPLTSISVSKMFVEAILAYLITCFTLPIRSICWTLWYKSLNKAECKIEKKLLDRATKSKNSPSFEIND